MADEKLIEPENSNEENGPNLLDETDGAEHLTLRVGSNITQRRLDKYIQGRLSNFSRTTLQKLINEQAVTINGKPAKPSTRISPGDVVDLILPPPQSKEIIPENIPLNIIYEDDDILVLNKQANLIVHPARSYKSGTLINALAYHAKELSKGSESRFIGIRPGIVHRLDRNTTGVLIVAKNDTAHWRLAKQFETRKTKKCYLAIVHGTPDLTADCINKPLAVHPRIREKMAVLPLGKEAITYYEVIERFKGYSLLRVNIKTGRTHQIRVHMSYIKHPIVGDDMYGGRIVYCWQIEDRQAQPEEPLLARPALHAWQLEITHPQTGKLVKFEAPVPDDMQKMLEELRKFRQISD
ncbi:MAG: RluA family pseudouridine synthase [Planctomycetes bacterium]|nr:RluA family pseudouridine synthase [Planctomycetota bacterium]MBU1517732.1 RluA family pseudouridine synthase [Planctomycetota bacterium]MBU2457852.1 RluA family pseudouridine synthase [Planctomycetota bacterium]MBU2597298.1 RluA family pseudouridine synthase [Planctomycetota bacterium]